MGPLLRRPHTTIGRRPVCAQIDMSPAGASDATLMNAATHSQPDLRSPRELSARRAEAPPDNNNDLKSRARKMSLRGAHCQPSLEGAAVGMRAGAALGAPTGKSGGASSCRPSELWRRLAGVSRAPTERPGRRQTALLDLYLTYSSHGYLPQVRADVPLYVLQEIAVFRAARPHAAEHRPGLYFYKCGGRGQGESGI